MTKLDASTPIKKPTHGLSLVSNRPFSLERASGTGKASLTKMLPQMAACAKNVASMSPVRLYLSVEHNAYSSIYT